jgi:hypothetical protein
MGISIDLPRIAQPALQRRVLAIGDCENETSAVEASLRFAGLLGKQGKIRAKTRGAEIVQTGDLLYKNAPSADVVGFWEDLRTNAAAADCSVHLVAGNHELEIWRRLQSGERLGLKHGERRAMQGLIRTTGLFHAAGSILFIHGYPTVKLLRHVQAYRVGTGKDINDYNRDCFRASLDDPKRLARYAYPRRDACRGCLLHDLPSPARYYRRHGREVAALLGSLGINLVIHGHRPERSGIQKDYELRRWLPGVRMISGDIQLRLQGPGATVIRQVENGPTDLLFVNRRNAAPAHRAAVRRVLRAPVEPVQNPPGLGKMGSQGQISAFLHRRDLIAPGIAASSERC